MASGCTTTKVSNVKYVKGKLLKQETSQPVWMKNEPVLKVTQNEIILSNKDIYQTKTIKIYEKIQSTNLNTKGTTVTDSPFWAIIGTPGALFLDAMTLGMMGATAEIWTEKENSWKTVKKKLENDFIVDEKDQYSNKLTPLPGQNIAVSVNNVYVTSLVTNNNGKTTYDFTEVLLTANVSPKNLVNDQGVEIQVAYADQTKKQTFKNKDIPEAFFARQFINMQSSLKQRAGRFDNCEFIAANKREFFECYYQ